MNGLEALSRVETLNDRITALNYAEILFREKEMGTGEIAEMKSELIEERDDIVEKLRAVNICES